MSSKGNIVNIKLLFSDLSQRCMRKVHEDVPCVYKI